MKYSLLIDITYLCHFHICFPPFFHLMSHAMMLSQQNFMRVSRTDVFAVHTFGQWKLIRHFKVNPKNNFFSPNIEYSFAIFFHNAIFSKSIAKLYRMRNFYSFLPQQTTNFSKIPAAGDLRII